ncbi:phosphatidate cytidylyltransferase [Scopulibacillus darangshiensis]|uniref:Phosphatidate cytidylyltransferase n=1 Tax=Scopulibacillus darangshiensis TaxID=442528 RepID=A0A4R2P8F0_9BACL|nr:phosphatidate cytidylyltransferase [Scopulibacillus darangshiensis]TCP30301.1 phosphatidate cytidylyltransferase [Scopulibacillus darangshiensis]
MKQRILTGVAAGALFILFILIGSVPFALFIGLIAAIAYFELVVMKGISAMSIPAISGGIYVFIFVVEAALPGIANYVPYMQLTAILIIITLLYMVFSKNTFNFDEAAHLFFSAFYIGLAFNLFVNLRYLPGVGLEFVFFIIILMWSTDSGAYFVGRKFGKRKLAPNISPNKTVEGMIGGIVIALIAAFIFEAVVPHPLFHSSWGLLVVVTLIISIFGQLGDLAESAIKRFYGVKDSGRILPGHGGLLDRFDSLIFILPILFVLNVIG